MNHPLTAYFLRDYKIRPCYTPRPNITSTAIALGITVGLLTDRHSKITPEHVAKVFDITIDKAKETLSKTTQMTIRQGVNPITRRYNRPQSVATARGMDDRRFKGVGQVNPTKHWCVCDNRQWFPLCILCSKGDR